VRVQRDGWSREAMTVLPNGKTGRTMQTTGETKSVPWHHPAWPDALPILPLTLLFTSSRTLILLPPFSSTPPPPLPENLSLAYPAPLLTSLRSFVLRIFAATYSNCRSRPAIARPAKLYSQLGSNKTVTVQFQVDAAKTGIDKRRTTTRFGSWDNSRLEPEKL